MPPNLKFHSNEPSDDDDEFLDVERIISQVLPPLTSTSHDDHDFFFHDIEQPSSQEKHHHDGDRASAIQSDEHRISNVETDHATHRVHHQHEHEHHRNLIHRLANLAVDDPCECIIDEQRLYCAVRDAGQFSYGVIACEVWVLEDDGRLARPKGGWWHNAALQSHLRDLLQLQDATPDAVLPGTELPGILWAENETEHHPLGAIKAGGSGLLFHHSTDKLQDLKQPKGSTDSLAVNEPSVDQATSHKHHHSRGLGSFAHAAHLDSLVNSHSHQQQQHSHQHSHPLIWRDLRSLLEDPDTAKTARMEKLFRAGLGAAAGVPFHIRHAHHHEHRGIVIYYARSHPAIDLISSIANETYLRASAEMIGNASAMTVTRRAAVQARKSQTRTLSKKFQKNLLEFYQDIQSGQVEAGRGTIGTAYANASMSRNGTGRVTTKQKEFLLAGEDDESSCCQVCHRWLRTWLYKCLGGNLQVPPPLTPKESLWTIFGAFCGLLVLSALNEYYMILANNDYYLLLAPFGALMTLQYGLTAAPASQPRNVVLGQAVAGAVSLAFTYVPDWILPPWLRVAVGPALGIGAMVKLGITHPPAGAHAVLYASGQYNWVLYALVVLSSAISVIPATLVNNMSSKRQYPTYWTLFKCPSLRSGGNSDYTSDKK